MTSLTIDKNADKTFIISSAYRTSGTETSFNVQLNQPIRNVRSVQLDMVQFNNNICPTEGSIFRWVETSYGGTQLSFTFPEDTFYTATQLATYIQTQMNTIGTGTYTVSITASNYFVFTSNVPFSLICNQPNNNIFYILGFQQQANNVFIQPFPGVPPGFTYLNTTTQAPDPLNNRINGLGISLSPLSTSSINNTTNNISYNYYVPVLHNYTEVEYFAANKDFNQTVKYFGKSFTFSSMKVDIGILFPSSQTVNFNQKLHSDIYLIFSYTTYDDASIILSSEQII